MMGCRFGHWCKSAIAYRRFIMVAELFSMANPNELLSQIETKVLWAYFHKDWLLEIRRELRQQLPASYHVFVESETILISPDSPDIDVTKSDLAVTRARLSESAESPQVAGVTAAVIDIEEPFEIMSQYSLIIRRSPENEVAAALEMLSPANKGVSGALDRDKYRQKRESYLAAGVSFLEIDALRQGERILPTRLKRLAEFERNAWTAFSHEGRRRLRGFGWNAGEPLPSIPWYIEAHRPVIVNLQATALAAFEFNHWEELAAEA